MRITPRTLALMAILAASVLSIPARAMTMKEFEAMPEERQSDYIVTFLEKMTYDLGQKNPELARQIKDFYVRRQPGKPVSEGIEAIDLELWAIDDAAKQGKADLSKIQVEGVIVHVTKQHFRQMAAG